MNTLKKVLIVDDDEITCYLQKDCLESMAIAQEIEYVHNGKEALHYIKDNCSYGTNRENCPVLIFLDINMPVMNGFEFLEELRTIENVMLENIYIVMLTSSVSPRDMQHASNHLDKLKGYIAKPLTEESVKRIMDEIKVV